MPIPNAPVQACFMEGFGVEAHLGGLEDAVALGLALHHTSPTYSPWVSCTSRPAWPKKLNINERHENESPLTYSADVLYALRPIPPVRYTAMRRLLASVKSGPNR